VCANPRQLSPPFTRSHKQMNIWPQPTRMRVSPLREFPSKRVVQDPMLLDIEPRTIYRISGGLDLIVQAKRQLPSSAPDAVRGDDRVSDEGLAIVALDPGLAQLGVLLIRRYSLTHIEAHTQVLSIVQENPVNLRPVSVVRWSFGVRGHDWLFKDEFAFVRVDHKGFVVHADFAQLVADPGWVPAREYSSGILTCSSVDRH